MLCDPLKEIDYLSTMTNSGSQSIETTVSDIVFQVGGEKNTINSYIDSVYRYTQVEL